MTTFRIDQCIAQRQVQAIEQLHHARTKRNKIQIPFSKSKCYAYHQNGQRIVEWMNNSVKFGASVRYGVRLHFYEQKKMVLDLFYFPYSYNCMMIRKASLVVQCVAYVIIEMMAMLRIRWLCAVFGRSFWLQMTTAEWNEMCAKLDENVSASLYKTKMYPMNDKRKNQ